MAQTHWIWWPALADAWYTTSAHFCPFACHCLRVIRHHARPDAEAGCGGSSAKDDLWRTRRLLSGTEHAVQGRPPVTGLSDHQLAGQGRAWHGHRRSATSDSYVAAS